MVIASGRCPSATSVAARSSILEYLRKSLTWSRRKYFLSGSSDQNAEGEAVVVVVVVEAAVAVEDRLETVGVVAADAEVAVEHRVVAVVAERDLVEVEKHEHHDGADGCLQSVLLTGQMRRAAVVYQGVPLLCTRVCYVRTPSFVNLTFQVPARMHIMFSPCG